MTNSTTTTRLALCIAIGGTCLATSASLADEKADTESRLRWVVSGAAGVDHADGFEDESHSGEIWQATTFNAVDPSVTIRSLDIDAEREKYLYLRLATTHRNTLRIFTSPDEDGPFYSAWSFKTGALSSSGTENIYRMDLSGVANWTQTVRSLRIKLMGHHRGDVVRLAGIGVSSTPLDRDSGLPVTNLAVNAAIESHDRMAGWQDALVSTNGTLPNSALYTYMMDRVSWASQHMLAKLVPGIELDGRTVWATAAERAEVVDVPGGVQAEFVLDGVRVFTEITPMMIGRDNPDWEGAAYYTIRTDPPTPVRLKCGGGREAFKHGPSADWVLTDSIAFDGARAEIDEGTAFLTSPHYKVIVGVRGSQPSTKESHANGAESVVFNFDEGQGRVMLAFSRDKQRVVSLTRLDGANGRKAVAEYYAALLDGSRIDTPEQAMDEAFRAAVLCLEYCWYAPYGWIEGIHHWVSMFHMQHTPAAQWCGQADRSRDCIVSHGELAFPNGAIPHLLPGGRTARHFGGHNQFYFWEVAEYWKHTADRDTLEKLVPALDHALGLTFTENDPDRDLLLGWGLQIGNQEDFIATPYNGSVPTIEGINMMRARAIVARALGDEKTARSMDARIRQVKADLRSELWMNDLGRFMYYEDPAGNARLDGQYQTYIYPLIDDIVDPFDAWTSMRHLRDRLTGANGEVYLSNNFPDHLLEIFATWGMQAGAAQQPWGAWGLAAMGLHNETWRPLNAISQWVMDDLKRGSWPEVAYDGRLGYFSPPAGLFIQSTVEALFGLRVDKPAGTLTVSPSFPDHWPSARLTLPGYSARYERHGDQITYTITSSEPLARRLHWLLPPCEVTKLLANGDAIDFKTKPGVDCITLDAETDAQTETTFELQFTPLVYEVVAPASIAEGEQFNLEVKGATIERVDDRCGVLSQSAVVARNKLSARIHDGLLAPYLHFGRLGQMNFSRRTFFLSCRPETGTAFWLPVDLTILPRYEATVRGAEASTDAAGENTDAVSLRLLLRNNTDRPLDGTAYFRALNETVPVEVAVQPRSQRDITVAPPPRCLADISPGDNRAVLILPPRGTIDLIIDGSPLIAANKERLQEITERTVQVTLPEDALTAWKSRDDLRQFYSHLTPTLPDPLSGFPEGVHELTIPELPGVSFKIDNRRFVPVSAKAGRRSFTLPLESKTYRKVYLLLVSFIENHDVFADIGRVELEAADPARHAQVADGIITRTLRSPGDLDWWMPVGAQVRTHTWNGPRTDRHGLLPLLGPADVDWPIARPPLFPQPEYWCDSLTVVTPPAILNVIEMDLAQPLPLKSLALSTLGPGPAFGLVAVSVELESGN